jgi:hypothetical protein
MATATPLQMANALKAAGFTGANVAIGVAVGLAESGGRTTVTHKNSNGSIDYGVWQINSVHSDILRTGDWSNINDNAKMAKKVFDGSGWKAWATFNSGSYSSHLATGTTAASQATGTVIPNSATTASLSIPGLDQLKAIGNFATFIADPNNWRRVGFFIAGGLLLVFALMKMTGNNQLSPTTKAIAGAAILK